MKFEGYFGHKKVVERIVELLLIKNKYADVIQTTKVYQKQFCFLFQH